MRRTVLFVITLLMLVGVTIVALAPSAAADAMPPPPPAPRVAAVSCPTGWGSQSRTVTRLSQAPIDAVRVGQHACYDRLVFDIAGSAGGYGVGYVTTVFSEGRGAPLNVPGGARLSVNVHDPLSHVATVSGLPWPVGGVVRNVSGFRTFRSLIFGGEFEGHSQFGLGVRARLPFRVFVLPAAGNRSMLVVDVAHTW